MNAVVIGIGNEDRGDDVVGRIVARRIRAQVPGGVRVLEESGEGTALMEAWRGADFAILIDAIHSGGRPGAIHRVDAQAEAIPHGFFHCSTHAFSVAEALELARALGELPPRLVLYGVEGKRFGVGASLSPEAEAAARKTVDRVQADLCMSSA